MAPGPIYSFKVREEAGQGTGDRVVVDHNGTRYRLVGPGQWAPYTLQPDGRITETTR